ncbi:MAG: hypothetical protein M0T71_05910 [Actinomycetota bacterium]|nr:hypothetical protein [Actinomycetota bacterium]
MEAAEVLAQLRADLGLREMARALLLGDELLRLPELFARLAEGQASLEAAVERLTDGQNRLFEGQARLFEGQASLEAAVERLTAGQARLFEGQASLEAAVERLTEGQARLFEGQASLEAAVERLTAGQARLFEGQARLEAAVERLTDGQAQLRKALGGLSNSIGGTAEEDAADVVEHVARLRGLRLLEPPTAVDLDGDGELDLWARVADAEGNELSILVEAKVRLRAREVRAWAARLEDPAFRHALAERGIAGPYLAYAFGIRIYAEARDVARSVGVGVLSARGEDVAPRPIAA